MTEAHVQDAVEQNLRDEIVRLKQLIADLEDSLQAVKTQQHLLQQEKELDKADFWGGPTC